MARFATSLISFFHVTQKWKSQKFPFNSQFNGTDGESFESISVHLSYIVNDINLWDFICTIKFSSLTIFSGRNHLRKIIFRSFDCRLTNFLFRFSVVVKRKIARRRWVGAGEMGQKGAYQSKPSESNIPWIYSSIRRSTRHEFNWIKSFWYLFVWNLIPRILLAFFACRQGKRKIHPIKTFSLLSCAWMENYKMRKPKKKKSNTIQKPIIFLSIFLFIRVCFYVISIQTMTRLEKSKRRIFTTW